LAWSAWGPLHISLSVRKEREDFLVLQELLEAGKVTPVIDRRYALSELPEALRYLGEGHARGKVVIAV
jgi:NADPH:quinone reductase-like Zn-dependent oxidoreductase